MIVLGEHVESALVAVAQLVGEVSLHVVHLSQTIGKGDLPGLGHISQTEMKIFTLKYHNILIKSSSALPYCLLAPMELSINT